ncbi:hypothetical protein [Amycolatopsis sp. WQ 127309]|uniref:hypothetical protein n=1 Tax=Amycolatopsis sp. WQ 127309 TaxID=2932773 RepID=UPI001FF52573|nr:hypothetical protein [Amycolatopsis sp. WQ 127309]UOZ05575.1 hypothetical protein MUY22_43230 [Amycolatopsis sp. WQ 127309]
MNFTDNELRARWRRTRRGGAALAALLSLSTLIAPVAQAAGSSDQQRAGAGGSTSQAWSPSLTPFWPNGQNGGTKEAVFPNTSTAARDRILNNCPRGFLCIADGEGDGQHTVYELFYCNERTLSNFIGRGAATNNQVGENAAILYQDRYLMRTIDPNNAPVRLDDWGPAYFLDPCL